MGRRRDRQISGSDSGGAAEGPLEAVPLPPMARPRSLSEDRLSTSNQSCSSTGDDVPARRGSNRISEWSSVRATHHDLLAFVSERTPRARASHYEGNVAKWVGFAHERIVSLSSRAMALKASKQDMDVFFSSYGFEIGELDVEEEEAMDLDSIGSQMESVERRRNLKGCCARLVHSVAFRIFFIVLITSNVGLLAYEAHVALREARTGDSRAADERQVLIVLDNVFTSLFVIEVIARCWASPVAPWKDLWLMGDAFIVSLAVLEEWILLPLFGDESEASGPFASATLLRLLRVLRMLRALRFLRLFQVATELRVIAEAIGAALFTTVWVFVILFIGFGAVAAICAILYEEDLGMFYIEGHEGQPVLDGIVNIMISLSMLTLQGIQWSTVFEEGWRVQPTLGLTILAYTAFALLGMLNIVMGSFVGSILSAKMSDDEHLKEDMLARVHANLYRLRMHFQSMDRNFDGLLSLEEFQEGLDDNPELCAALGFDAADAPALYRLAVKSEEAPANADDLLMAILKLGMMSVSWDMLSMDRMQSRCESKTNALADDYDRGMTVIGRLLEGTMAELDSIEDEVRTLMKAPLPSGQAVLAARGARQDAHSAPPQTPEEAVFQHLERKYDFADRLHKVGEQIGAATAAQRSALPADVSHKAADMWRELYDDEVAVWLRTELAKLPPRRAASPPAPEADPGRAALDREAAVSAFNNSVEPQRSPLLPTQRVAVGSPWAQPRFPPAAEQESPRTWSRSTLDEVHNDRAVPRLADPEESPRTWPRSAVDEVHNDHAVPRLDDLEDMADEDSAAAAEEAPFQQDDALTRTGALEVLGLTLWGQRPSASSLESALP